MIGPREIKTKALRRYKELCRQWISGEDPYPLNLRVSLSPSGLSESDLLAGWDKLYRSSKAVSGYGYLIEFKEKRTRSRGVQNIPGRIVIPSREDHLKLISMEKDFTVFQKDVMDIRSFLPGGGIEWCENNVSLILRNPSSWDEITGYVSYLKEHPGLDYSPREVPVADSKFFERHRPAIKALATEALGISLQDWDLKSRWRPTLKFLDPALRLWGFSKISVDLEELAGFSPVSGNPAPRIRQLLIVENGATFDSLPGIPGTLALWGEGNAVQALRGMDWLNALPLYYWGDMDLDGLAILSRFRRSFPHVKSLAMGLDDFLRFEEFAVDTPESAGSPGRGIPDSRFLNEDENRLKEFLLERSKANRLEQERIPMEYILKISTSPRLS